MINYSSCIDNRNNYYLPLINNSIGNLYCNYKLPLSFYAKYSNLLKNIPIYLDKFKKINSKNLFKNNILLTYNDYYYLCLLTTEIESINTDLNYIIEDINKLDFTSSNIEVLLNTTKRVLLILKELSKNNNYDIDLLNIDESLKEIKNLGSIIYESHSLKYLKIKLPDSWYILPNGELYNTGNGHQNTNLLYDINLLKNNFNRTTRENSKYYLDLYNKIKLSGFTEIEFKTYLNYKYTPFYSDNGTNIPTCHEKNTLNHILGIIKAKYYFYKYIEDLKLNTTNPDIEFNKLLSLCYNDSRDLLVRYAHFSKIESVMPKTITTSIINYQEEFRDFISNGWTINFIPPIIISKSRVVEYPKEYLLIRNLLKESKY